MKTSQRYAILRHLKKRRFITPMEALNLYHSFRLAVHINVLRNRGHNILTHIVRTDEGTTYAKYEYLGETNGK